MNITETNQSILKKRAQELAQPLSIKKHSEQQIELLEFELNQEHYGIQTIFIQEVYPLQEWTELPGTPDYILGIFNVRRRIVPLIDLRALFNISRDKPSNKESHQVIILQQEETQLAILTNNILGIRYINPEELQPTHQIVTDGNEAYIKGITHDQLIIINAEYLLKNPLISN